MVRHVLLVDDDPNLLAGLRRSLHREPYQIHCALSASEAFLLLKREPVDLVISDLEMPGMNGLEFLVTVREVYPTTVRFILTGKATVESVIAAVNQGSVTRFLTKPCDIHELALNIHEALKQKRLLEETRKLLGVVKNQNRLIDRLRQRHPELLDVHRDADGSVVIDDIPTDFEEFIKAISAEMKNVPTSGE